MAQLKNTTIDDTGNLTLPSGTTAARPSGSAGQMRFNTETSQVEFYDVALDNWVGTPAAGVVATGGTVYDVDADGTTYRVHVFTATGNSTFTVTKGGEVEYLIVGGGGGGSNYNSAGGGGAGGLLTGTTSVTSQNYTTTVGAGGLPGVGGPGTQGATNGGNSSFGSVAVAIGGGAGGQGNFYSGRSPNDQAPSIGGSGGGARAASSPNTIGAAGTAGQGNAGGNSGTYSGGYPGGGGGGAGGQPGSADGSGIVIVRYRTS